MEENKVEVLLIPGQIEGLLKNEKKSGQAMAKAFSAQISKMMEDIKAIKLTSKENAAILADKLTKGRAGFTTLDTMRKGFNEPYKTSIDNINAYWKTEFKTEEFKELLDEKKKELAAFEKEEKAKADKIAQEKKRAEELKAKEEALKFKLFNDMQLYFQMVVDALISADTGKQLTELFHTYLNPQNTEVATKKDLFCKYWEEDYTKLYNNAKAIGKTRAEEIKNKKPVSEDLVVKQQEMIKEQEERQAEVEDQKLEADIAQAQALKKIEAEIPTSNTYERFTWTGIIDKTINEVDRQFLELSPSAIEEYIKKNKVNLVEGAVFGGIRFVKKGTTVLKS